MSRFLTQRTSPSYVYDTCSNIRTEREAEDKRLEEIFSSQPAIDDGVDAYEDVGSGEVYSEADEVKGESAGDKNPKVLVDADYDDYDDGGDGHIDGDASGTSP